MSFSSPPRCVSGKRSWSCAGAFLSLPGGFGTLEETVEILTLKQLGYHGKPIVLLNSRNFWDPLLLLFEHMEREQFTKPEARELYYVAAGVAGALDYLPAYEPPLHGSKWF